MYILWRREKESRTGLWKKLVEVHCLVNLGITKLRRCWLLQLGGFYGKAKDKD